MEVFFELRGGDPALTLQDRIFNAFRDAVVSGRLAAGARAPSSRELAATLGVSRNTVTEAYARLEAEGYLQSRGRVGMFIATTLPEICLSPPFAARTRDDGATAGGRTPTAVFDGPAPTIVEKGVDRPPIDFWYGQSDPRCFPLSAWRRIIVEKFGAAAANLTHYPPAAGLPELRSAIAEHLRASRGLRVNAERVIVTAGAQEAFSLVAKAFVAPGAEVVVENPCYQGFALACRAQGACLRPVSVGPEGIELEQLSPETQPSLIYVTPSHQFPTGVTMPLERRRSLLDVAARLGAYVVEDDYDSEFRYDGPPVLALAGLDGAGERVLYVGTFSKSLGAALRIGFIVAPESVVGTLTKAKALASGGQPWLDQACLATFIASGEYRRHLRRLREARRQSKDALLAALTRHFGAPELSGAEGGMHVLWRLPPFLPAADFVDAARRFGVGVYTPSAAGALAFGEEPNAIVLGYSALSLEEIDKGAAALAKAARDFGVA